MGALSQTSLMSGDFVMTADDFHRITSMLHADSGIAMNDTKVALVYSRLGKRLRALGLQNFRDYCALVSDAQGVDERQRMLSALTTNLTRFFREPHHFEHLKSALMPRLAASLRRGDRVRIWSAGCSNGAEPYSIALTLLQALPDAADYDIRILASDIDDRMVAFARAGLYDPEQTEPVPPALRDRWMRAGDNGGWTVGPEMRRLVAFRELNLVGPWPMAGKFDAIFCRNVAIYFDEPTQNELWRRMAALLTPEGRLYIGHSERLGGQAQAQLRTDGVTTYALRGGDR